MQKINLKMWGNNLIKVQQVRYMGLQLYKSLPSYDKFEILELYLENGICSRKKASSKPHLLDLLKHLFEVISPLLGLKNKFIHIYHRLLQKLTMFPTDSERKSTTRSSNNVVY